MSQPRERFPERAFKFGSLTAPVLTLILGWGFVLLEVDDPFEFEDFGHALFAFFGAIMVSLLAVVFIYPISAITGGLFLWTMMKAEERMALARHLPVWMVSAGLFSSPTAYLLGYSEDEGSFRFFGWWIIMCGVVGAAVGWLAFYGKTFKSAPETLPEQSDTPAS